MLGEGESCAESLLPPVYHELLGLARKWLARCASSEAMSPAELVHEAYLRVLENEPSRFEGCSHFFFVISRAMRDLIVEDVRRHATLKRGGGRRDLSLETVEIAVQTPRRDFVDLQRALRKLARESHDCAQVVVLSYFAGLTHPEIAKVTGMSRATVERRSKCARLWLRRELAGKVETT